MAGAKPPNGVEQQQQQQQQQQQPQQQQRQQQQQLLLLLLLVGKVRQSSEQRKQTGRPKLVLPPQAHLPRAVVLDDLRALEVRSVELVVAAPEEERKRVVATE
jgi:hypothetical protein